jgi:integrase
MRHRRTRYQQGSLTTETRKDGPVWIVRWRERVAGRSVQRKLTLGPTKQISKTAAKREVAKLLQQVNSPAVPTGDPHMTVRDLVEHFLEHEFGEGCGRTVKAVRLVRDTLNNHVLPTWGSYRLDEVKAPHVESWLKSLDKANPTKAKIRDTFSQVYRHGIRHEICQHNPIASVRQSRKRTSEPHILEPSETGAILRELEGVEPARTAFLLGAVTGMRVSEILGLQWHDIDFQRAILHVRRSCVDGVIGECKTASSRKPLPLPEQALEALSAWREQSSYTKPDSWVFASDAMFGQKPLWAGSMWIKNIAPAITRADIKKPKLRWHTLRRSYASLLLTTGADLRTSMELMLHVTSAMTLETYGQSTDGAKREATDKAARLIRVA